MTHRLLFHIWALFYAAGGALAFTKGDAFGGWMYLLGCLTGAVGVSVAVWPRIRSKFDKRG